MRRSDRRADHAETIPPPTASRSVCALAAAQMPLALGERCSMPRWPRCAPARSTSWCASGRGRALADAALPAHRCVGTVGDALDVAAAAGRWPRDCCCAGSSRSCGRTASRASTASPQRHGSTCRLGDRCWRLTCHAGLAGGARVSRALPPPRRRGGDRATCAGCGTWGRARSTATSTAASADGASCWCASRSACRLRVCAAALAAERGCACGRASTGRTRARRGTGARPSAARNGHDVGSALWHRLQAGDARGFIRRAAAHACSSASHARDRRAGRAPCRAVR